MDRPTSDQIAAELRRRIGLGRGPGPWPPDALPPLSSTPSVRELAARYEVRREAAERAIALLKHEGLILYSTGRTSMVAPPIPLRTVRHDRVVRRDTNDLATLFPRDMAAIGWVGETSYQFVGETGAPEWAAEALGLELGAPVWGRERVLIATPIVDGEPNTNFRRVVGLHDGYYDLHLLDALPALHIPGPSGTGGMFSRMAEAGIVLDPLREVAFTRPVTEAEAETMGIPRTRDVGEMVRTISASGIAIAAEIEVSLPGWLRREYEVAV